MISDKSVELQVLYWAIIVVSSMLLVAGILGFYMWIKYSWFRRTNSKGYNGAQLTREVLNNSGMNTVEIKSSFLYAKFWNHNKRRGTYRLRPWTHNRSSIFTMMEAAQQAYATTIRSEKGSAFWLLFRLPSILKGVGTIAFIISFFAVFKSVHEKPDFESLSVSQWFGLGMGLSTMWILFTLAEAGRYTILYRNVPAMLSKMGFSEYEVKAIKNIFLIRVVQAVLCVLLEMLKTIYQIIDKVQNAKSI